MLGTSLDSVQDLNWGKFQGGEKFGEGAALFPRIVEEIKKPEKTEEAEKAE